MENKFVIKVNILDRSYPISLDKNDTDTEVKEERLRLAAKTINDAAFKMKQRKYSNKDDQDYVAMVALHFVTKLIETKDNTDIGPLVQRIKDIDDKIEEYLK